MTGRAWATVVAAAGAIVLGGPRCSPQCVHPPCVAPTAMMISVTSPTGDPITTASVETANASSAIPCHSGSSQNICVVMGGAGSYNVRVTATGYQPATQTVVVTGTSSVCGCGTVDTRMVTIVLTPA